MNRIVGFELTNKGSWTILFMLIMNKQHSLIPKGPTSSARTATSGTVSSFLWMQRLLRHVQRVAWTRQQGDSCSFLLHRQTIPLVGAAAVFDV